MSYERQTYTLTTYTLTVPAVTNAGDPSGYLETVREALSHCFTGWTEAESVGYWEGKLEPGHVLTIYAAETVAVPAAWSVGGIGAHVAPTADVLGYVGRACMPDQDAIQVTIGPAVELREA